MAVTAKFQADFANFYDAVQKAETKLVDFSTGAGKVEGALNRMVDGFSGRKLIQDATLMADAVNRVGGVTKLTEDELQRLGAKASEAAEKMRAMGIGVPDKIQQIADAAKQAQGATSNWSTALSTATGVLAGFGISLSIGQLLQWGQAFVGMGKAIFDNAGALSDMSAKTGLSVVQLQKFAEVGAAAHVSVEDFTQATFKLGIALEGGENSVVDGVSKLGLNYQKLLNMRPDEQFNTVAKALEGVSNVQERNRLGFELMGKSFAAVAPAITKGFTEMAAQARAATDEQVSAIDHLGDAWDMFVVRRKNQATSLAGATILGVNAFSDLSAVEKLSVLSSSNLFEVWDRLRQLGEARSKQVDIELPKEEHRTVTTKAQAAAAEKLAEAMLELDSVGKGWQGTLNTIDGSVAEAIKYYLAAGVSQNALATAYGLTLPQVKSVDSATKDYAETLKAVAKIEADERTKQEQGVLGLGKLQQEASQKHFEAEVRGIEEITKVSGALRDFQMKNALDTASFQIVKIWEAADNQVAAFKGTTEQLATFTETVMDLAAREANAVVYEANKMIDAVTAKAMGAAGAIQLAIQQVEAGLAVDVVANAQVVGASASSRPAGFGTGRYVDGVDTWAVPHRASGGAVSMGQPHWVGERGPELFVPSVNGSIVPNGGGGSVVNNFYVNGTAEDVARKIQKLIMRSVSEGKKMSA